MKKIQYFIVAALALFTAACASEDFLIDKGEVNQGIPAERTDVIYIDAVSENSGSTKSAVDGDGVFEWSEGDRVAVYAGGGYKVSDALATGGSGVVQFSFSGNQTFVQSDRANFAVFPAALVYDETGNLYADDVTAPSLKINLPTAYDLSEVNDNNAPTPMISTNSPDGSLAFKSVCALLKFTLHSVPKQTRYLTFDFNGRKVCGEFELTEVVPGQEDTRVETSATEGFDDVITIYNDVFTTFQNDLVVNVPVPAGEYSKVTITSWDGDPWDGGHKINGITSFIRTKKDPDDPKKCLAWNAGRLSSGRRELYLPVFSISGTTAVGDGTKIIFAPGNLTAEIATLPSMTSPAGSAVDWKFAENQYDAVNYSDNKAANTFAAGSVGKRIDSFAWIGESATKEDYQDNQLFGVLYPNYSSTLPSEQRVWSYWVGQDKDLVYIKRDWGTLSIGGGVDLCGNPSDTYPASTWRLPSYNVPKNKHEMWFVSEYRESQGVDYVACKASIKDSENLIANGLVIFPDHYAIPDVPVGMPTMVKTTWSEVSEDGGAHYADNVLSLDDWAALESVGCVFLPAATCRFASSIRNEERIGDGYYWTNYAKSTSINSQAMAFAFSDLNASSASSMSATDFRYSVSYPRNQGAAVRLICEIN